MLTLGRQCKPPGRFALPAPILPPALTLSEDPEHVIIAGSGVVGEDGSQHIGTRDPARRDVETAALTLPVAAPETSPTADGVVVFNRVAQEEERRVNVPVHEDPAPQAIAAAVASAPSAADGAVVSHSAVADGERRAEQIGQAAAPAVTALAAGPAGAADRLVVGERAIAEGGVHDAGGEEVGGVRAAALGETADLAGGPGSGDSRVVLERAAGDRGDSTGDVDAPAKSVVGAGKSGARAGIPVATDGLVVVERAAADHQHRCRGQGGAAHDGAGDTEAGTRRAGAVVAADRLVMAERAARDGEGADIEDGAAAARSGERAAAVAAGPGHVVSEQTVGDARGGRAKVGDGAAVGIAGAVAAAAIGAQGQVAEEGTAGDGQRSVPTLARPPPQAPPLL